MADTIPDLWPTQALKTDVLNPIAILRTQATKLGQRTQGLLVAEATVTNGENGQVVLGLEVVVPALNNYRHRLLSVKHTQEAIYPAKISARGLTITQMESVIGLFPMTGEKRVKKSVSEKTAYSESDFVDILTEALQAPETIALLQSLIVRSNEEMSDALITDEEDEGIEQQKE